MRLDGAAGTNAECSQESQEWEHQHPLGLHLSWHFTPITVDLFELPTSRRTRSSTLLSLALMSPVFKENNWSACSICGLSQCTNLLSPKNNFLYFVNTYENKYVTKASSGLNSRKHVYLGVQLLGMGGDGT